jgi:hypothetical protein
MSSNANQALISVPHHPSKKTNRLTTLLLGDTDGPASAASRLGVLAADAEAPVVTETAVGADLLQALEVVAELRVDAVGEDLAVLAVDDVALPVEEPGGDLVLGRVLDDGDDTLELFGRKLTGAVRGGKSVICSLLFSFQSKPGSRCVVEGGHLNCPQFHAQLFQRRISEPSNYTQHSKEGRG